MKRNLFLFIIAIIFQAGALYSQEGPGPQPQRMKPEEMARKQADMMTKEFNLNQTDSEKAYQIMLKQFKAMDEQMSKGFDQGDMDANMEAMKKLRDERDKDLKALLGEKNFNTFIKEEEANRPDGPMGPPPGENN